MTRMLTKPFAAGALAVACTGNPYPLYHPPAIGAPHAIVELRSRYVPVPSNKRIEWLTLNGARVLDAIDTPDGVTRTLSVAPGRVDWVLSATFAVTHTETQMLTQVMGTGFIQVPVEVDVDDAVAVCRATLAQQLEPGNRYFLLYDFQGNERCAFSCWRLRPGSATRESCP